MKVLFLTMWYPSEDRPAKANFVREHARAVSLEHDVTVLHLAGRWHETQVESGLIQAIDNDALTYGLPTFRTYYRPARVLGTEFARFFFGGIRAIRQIDRQEGPFDIIHAHEFDAGLVAVAFSRFSRPVLVTEHSTAFPRRALKRRAMWRARMAFRLADFVLPVSHALAHSISEQAPGGNCVVVPNTVDLKLFSPRPRPQSRVKRLTVVSRLNEIKGISVLLEACQLLTERRTDWMLDIIGDGEERQNYEAMARLLGVAGRVTFHGIQTRSSVANFMQGSDLHIVPSRQETFCVVAIEALACGTPVVATRSGGPEEFVRPEFGLLVDPGDPVLLASAVDSGLDGHFATRNEISEYARRHFSHEAVGSQMSSLYRRALARRGIVRG